MNWRVNTDAELGADLGLDFSWGAWPNMLMRQMEACDWLVCPYPQFTPTH